MCSPDSVPHLDIDASATDEEVILFLGRRTAKDPVPSNIITEVNPFSIEPGDSPEGMWYLYNPEDGQSFNRKNIFKETKFGYWRSMEDVPITVDNVTAGRKTSWEFYFGQKPFGNKTGWLMYDYHTLQKNLSSICRVFLQDDQRKDISDYRCPAGSDDANDAVNHFEPGSACSLPMALHQTAEQHFVMPDIAADDHVGAYETRSLEPSNFFDNVTMGNSAEDSNVLVELLRGEYLELDDFDESTSSSSNNSSRIFSNFDDFFDAEAALKDMEDEIRDSPRNYSYPVDEVGIHTRTSPSNCNYSKSTNTCPISVQQVDANASVSVSNIRGQPKRTHSGSSESSSGSSGTGSKSVRRIAKLGKKYCCFGPF
ncbi:hypothetical protein HPP92_019971 [Vanilla planifolia]|uniref:NAC domain-containing protein n=1 Tax=Vanilla planifolia TaxID=51239 RepID=A0A835QDI6_VANPL|nr:hypothetical protein HPP92_019971 [Vanilla planifolia]